ncbi:MAG: choice-of-anchor Q domain-containing protein [Thermoanaerobaculia bacterium]
MRSAFSHPARNLLAALLVAVAAPAADFTVTTLADAGPGSLRAAMEDANALPGADAISFAATGTIALASSLPSITDDLTIDGPGAASLTVAGTGAGSFRFFHIAAAATVEVSGMSITAGQSAFHNKGTLTVRHVAAFGNDTHYGGMMNNEGVAVIEDSIMTDNHAVWGGALRNGPTGTLTVRRSTMARNEADQSGGAIQGGVGITLEDCTIADNLANQGGAINLQTEVSKDVTITNCTITGNRGTREGSRYAGGGIMQIVFGNRTLTSTLRVVNSTIVGNTAFSGGGIWSGNFSPGSTTLRLELVNTIVAGNTITDGSGPDLDVSGTTTLVAEHNLIGDGDSSGISHGANGNQVGTTASPIDPLLGALADHGGPTETRALLVGSPAIDAGTTAGAPAADQRGRARDASPDIGAFEVTPNEPPAVSASAVTVTQGTSGVFTIGSVSDRDQSPDTIELTATLTSGSGIALHGMSVDAAGDIAATLTASCDATDSSFELRAADDQNVTATATLAVSVVQAPAPFFTQHPAPASVCVFEPVTLTASLEDANNSLQWFRDGAPLNGEDGLSLTIDHATSADEGSYVLVASNACRKAQSNAAVVAIDPIEATVAPLFTVEADASCHADVPVIQPTFTSCGSSVEGVSQSPAAGTKVGLGDHDVTISMDDIGGGTSFLTTTLRVVDTTAPSIDAISASPEILWPPNHQMIPVTVTVDATDACGTASCRIVAITSNEPANGRGDGNDEPDWIITGDLTAELRAERSGKGSGRVYTLTIACSDGTNESVSEVTVTVPRNR